MNPHVRTIQERNGIDFQHSKTRNEKNVKKTTIYFCSRVVSVSWDAIYIGQISTSPWPGEMVALLCCCHVLSEYYRVTPTLYSIVTLYSVVVYSFFKVIYLVLLHRHKLCSIPIFFILQCHCTLYSAASIYYALHSVTVLNTLHHPYSLYSVV